MQSGLLHALPLSLVSSLVHRMMPFLLKRMKYFLFEFQCIDASPFGMFPIFCIEIENALLSLVHVHRHTAWMVLHVSDKVSY